MKKLTLIGIVLLLYIAAFGSCISAGSPVTTPQPEKAVARVSEEVPRLAAWEQRWNDTLKEAKKEGKLVFYSVANPQSRIALGKAFREKFGLDVEFVTTPGAELPRKLENERRAGLKLADLYNSGATILFYVKPMGALEPLEPYVILPEVLDKNAWLPGTVPFVDSDRLIIAMLAGASHYLLINTDMVKEGYVKSYLDLLNPEWKGRILMFDPSISGGGNEWTTMMLVNVLGMEKGKEFLLKFASQEPVMVRDTRLSAEWAARGKYPLAIGAYKQAVSEFQGAGAPLKYQKVAEGGLVTASGGMLAKIEGGPNPHATTVFLNWLLSKEGQTIYARNYGFPSARIDVPTEGIDPSLVPGKGEKLTMTDEEWHLMKEKLIPLIKEMFRL